MPCREWESLLDKGLYDLSLEVPHAQKKMLLKYTGLLLTGLKGQRLVGESSARDLLLKHICDSVYPLSVTRVEGGSLLDLGTGAGLPGIPLKICLPEVPVYLMDSHNRKLLFLRRVVRELNLNQVYFLPGRAEEWGRVVQYRESFDWVVSRAVAQASVIIELAMPLLKVGGVLLLFKGRQGHDELKQASRALSFCGGQLTDTWEYHLMTGEKRLLFQISKTAHTPQTYPRRTGKPAKSPL